MRRLVRQFVVSAVSRFGLSRLVFRLHRTLRGRGMLVIFTYHRIVDGSLTRTFYTDYDRGTDVGMFERHLVAIRRHYRLVDLHEFIRLLRGEYPLTFHAAMLTFDDADSDLLTTALPVLQRHRTGGVVAAPVELIGSDERLWHVRMSNLFRYISDDHWSEIQSRSADWPPAVARIVRDTALPTVDRRRDLCRAVNRALDTVDHDTVDRVVEEWENIVQPPEQLPITATDWTQLMTMEKSGLQVESHGLTHRKLTTLTKAQMGRELSESKHLLEERLGKTVRAIAYPQGYYDDRVLESARDAGYEIGLTTQRTPCNVPSDGLDNYRVPRTDVFGDTPEELDYYFAKLCLKSLFRHKPW